MHNSTCLATCVCGQDRRWLNLAVASKCKCAVEERLHTRCNSAPQQLILLSGTCCCMCMVDCDSVSVMMKSDQACFQDS